MEKKKEKENEEKINIKKMKEKEKLFLLLHSIFNVSFIPFLLSLSLSARLSYLVHSPPKEDKIFSHRYYLTTKVPHRGYRQLAGYYTSIHIVCEKFNIFFSDPMR